MARLRSRAWVVGLSLITLSALPIQSMASAQTDEEVAVTQLAHDFMAALSSRNASALADLLAPQAMLYSVRESDEGPRYGVRTREDFLQGIESGSSTFLERIWDPVVEVQGRVAMVWAPYDFHAGGDFSHCGIDLLTYLKLEDGWKVTSITYDMITDGCPPSPLGAPGG